MGMTGLLGVLGGMGPLAAADFFRKLVSLTPARCDQEHIPLVIYSVPQIPDRVAAINDGGESPLPAMLAGVRALKAAGALRIAIACNTAHYWADELEREGGVPILHIADAACDALARRVPRGATLGLMGTRGTLAAGFYQKRLAARGYGCITSTDEEIEQLVHPAIAAVKRNALDTAAGLARTVVERLRAAGAAAVILGCTEIPVAVDHAGPDVAAHCVDATHALAGACLAWWQGHIATAARAQ
jgi:aspartate racemase